MIVLKGRDEHLPTKNGVPLTIGLFRVKKLERGIESLKLIRKKSTGINNDSK